MYNYTGHFCAKEEQSIQSRDLKQKTHIESKHSNNTHTHNTHTRVF